ncbi:MAG: aminodeoxychorismate/anthranilate synthase component II [Anaerolineales bacterium]|nr:aminodeoxychorismate/anthranilate synthase component II [Anaerolineales bacterium]
MITVIDNYDSFTFNLVQYLGELHPDIHVIRNDETSVEEIRAQHPDFIVISPGPGEPGDAGISKQVILELGPNIPVLGICLGHQCLGEVYGGKVERAPRLMHGKTSPIYHQADAIFDGLPSPFEATRYHSLIVEEDGLPEALEVIAQTSEGEIMGLKHRQYPVYGLQFHPESILTQGGKQILKNFLTLKVPTF